MLECGIVVDDIMYDDISCEYLQLASVTRMDDIILDVCQNVVLGLMI